ncbi:1,6-anhydro-N-acetylmuramyl-L-alanine amidase AmpD [Pseudoalteromonas sp. McH1-7]|uniref:1,6-anhydro-N-acetylmuramyl-L-alanine amidase AmpD n=1 Tax=Pseudoalteromonas TaxID=53246 RepID=UPI000F64DA95|nr:MULTISPECIES: 1,6-anhydro-N-acetylmuramyl-L-alanine amidase AmpD [Pseudoalteromonas]MDW7549685.1 1,6-anhydro-N-acetylmuramyl-L-alanine amidase AmpD [Pseudoalteromonas peptidolytica]NUZ13176.1 1,6-anhydro-N-acetylmuramyl-L-alanine amidase AmpD [Pseudoalteromonas sp. McH1-7]RRS10729.1 1,6-anhydro-N-acetylmuramyl-L-alanine amidase AmpD [Pseudoalteromonas sp. J010]USD29320.1 1,6-anhydro-N-acetylmuramyl-L-alanine amidase AmpD [Pseudoalteromonas sp. SCSIO 43201]
MNWLPFAERTASPHYNERPIGCEVDLLVIHNISLPAGCFGTPYIDALFMGKLDCHAHPTFADLKGLEVSAHCVIKRDGSITQYVSFSERAWHAGVSQWQGKAGCNDFAIGIELEGTDTIAYTQAQYMSLVKTTRWLQHYYPKITNDRIVGHNDIAPGRKTDPGAAFDWQHYFSLLNNQES